MSMSNRIQTIILLMFLATTIALSGCSVAKAPEIKQGKEITFFTATDIHYLAQSLKDGGEAFQQFVKDGDGRELKYLDEIMDAFARDIKLKKAEVLIISGDLTTNGEKESHLELAKILKEIEKSGTAVYVIPGNHDILNPNARSFKGSNQHYADYITPKAFQKIYKDFGYEEAVSKDKTTLSYLAAPSEDVWLLMLDTAQYDNNLKLNNPQMDGRIPEDTLKWVKQCSDLAKKKGAQLVGVMHHNLMDHNDRIKKGYTINNSEEVIKLFKECDISFTLSGHTHIQDIKSNVQGDKPIYDIVTASLGLYPQKYGVIKYTPGSGFDYHTENVDVQGWAKETGAKDINLNNFKEYSRAAYGERLYSKVVSRLAMTDFYTSEELQSMAEVYRELNLKLLEGQKKVGTEEILNSKGFKLWEDSEGNSSQQGVLRLAKTDGESSNILSILTSKHGK